MYAPLTNHKPKNVPFGEGHNAKQRQKLFRDLIRRVCFYCADPVTEKTFTVDHIIPVSRGGTGHRFNLLISCVPCNQLRGNKPVLQFLDEIGYDLDYVLKPPRASSSGSAIILSRRG